MKNNKLYKRQFQLFFLGLILLSSACVKNQVDKIGMKQDSSNVKPKEIMNFGVPEIIESDSFIYKKQIVIKGKKNDKIAMRGMGCDPENWDPNCYCFLVYYYNLKTTV